MMGNRFATIFFSDDGWIQFDGRLLAGTRSIEAFDKMLVEMDYGKERK